MLLTVAPIASKRWSGADLQPIYARFASLASDDALALVRDAFASAPESGDDRRSARMLLEWIADLRVSRALAALDERELQWEASAVVRLEDGRQIPYARIAIEIAITTSSSISVKPVRVPDGQNEEPEDEGRDIGRNSWC